MTLDEKREEWLEAFGRVYDLVPLSWYDETTKLAQYAWDEMFATIEAQARVIDAQRVALNEMLGSYRALVGRSDVTREQAETWDGPVCAKRVLEGTE